MGVRGKERQRNQTYLKVSELSAEYHRSKPTVYNDLKVIEKDERYKGFWVYLQEEPTKMVNRNVYEDYLHYKAWLQDRNLRKHLQPFDPVMVRRQRGEECV